MRRIWLLPFSPIYWIIVSIRNSLFDLGVLRSHSFEVPILCIGNISAGGTGKTPHTEWVLDRFQEKYRIAVLSRGYGRSTKGFKYVEPTSSASEVGDEPLQISQRFPKVTVAVCEDRVFGIEMLLTQAKRPELIVLDDAFQHRYIQPGLSWILTPWDDLYTKDYMLPAGNLREDSRSAERADLITVTKCPGKLSTTEREALREELSPTDIQTLGFSRMKYASLVDKKGDAITQKPSEAVVVTGIAKPAPLLKHFKDHDITCHHIAFKDHRQFTHADVHRILIACQQLDEPVIITTRKDYVRWPENDELSSIPTFIQDIEVEMDDDEGVFYRIIDRFIADFEQ